ncbi:mannitol dehydrogenase family protein [Mariniflexile soesokkakense]|uniref:Mannitol dehydrogenase family protein n=2 Tax=Mariniflexile soesokkakense TaxID=1343160 RepID=A0ABV0ACK4_9FLAO
MENLKLLPETVLKPSFERDKIKTSILHIGVSNFHRSHQAYYIHELMEKFNELNYGICGVDLLDSDRKIYNILKDQDGLYTLYTKEPNGAHKAKIIGSIVEYFFGPENPLAVIEKMTSPDIEIISLTIAEDGYHLNEITGALDLNQPILDEEIKNPFNPKTVFGYLTQAFKLRKLRNLPGCTILSCDNIKSNGDTIKKALLEYVSKTEPELLNWISKNTTFPNTMVDRITTITDFNDIETLKQDFFIEDQWPVVCEPFAQWIIEDKFLHKKPSWEKVGVQFTQNIEPFEKMKLRLLNASHTILGILGTMSGHKTVYEAAIDDNLMTFLKSFMDEEVHPTLNESNATHVSNYKKMLVSRFQNPHINDRLSRICQESSAKIPIFILPIITDQLQNEQKIKGAAFIIAAWCKYNDGIDDHGNTYKIVDSISNTLIRMAALSHQNPLKFLDIETVFNDLNTNTFFTETYLKHLNHLRTHSISESITAFNKNTI